MPIFLRWLLRLGPINPIAVRLVQGGSRRKRHLYIRTVYLGALTIILLYLLLINAGGGSPDSRKLALATSGAFQFVAYVQIGLICLLAPVFMAGAIAQEANPRTWDILLTTPLGAGEIVLGNLLGRLFFILALLFSSLPLFALTQYFGGVPGQSVFASYLIAACAALIVGSMAIALSVSRLVGKRAVFTFYVSIVSYFAITWLIDRLMGGGRVSYMTALNPFLALRALLDPTGYPCASEGSFTGLAAWFLEAPVTTWCLISSGLSLLLLAASTITVRAGGIAGLGGMGGRGESATVPWYRRMFGLSGAGAQHRPARTVWQNPIAWREAAARNATLGRMIARWSFIGAGALFAVGLVIYFHNQTTMSPVDFRAVVQYSVLGELGVVCLVALNMAATSVAREREDGTLDLLLTTPITARAYLGGKVRGMVAYLLPLLMVPVGTLLVAGLYVGAVQAEFFTRTGGVTVVHTSTVSASSTIAVTIQVPAVLPEAGLIAGIVGVPFLAFCCMVGLQWSLKSKGSIGAVVSTVGVVGVIAGIVGLCAVSAGSGLPVFGPVLAAATPATAVYAATDAADAMLKTIDNQGLATARLALFVGALVFAGVYAGVVYGLRSSMEHGFDMTVRKLAGIG